jgi:hypothetical protein
MTDTDTGPDPGSEQEPAPADRLADWLTVEQAAGAYGVTVRTMWRRLSQHKVDARQVITPTGKEWRIRPPVTPAEGQAGSDQEPGRALIPVAALQQLIEPILQERAELREEISRLQEARLDDAQELGRVRGRMEALEAELARLRSDSTPAPPAAAPTARRRWPWQR